MFYSREKSFHEKLRQCMDDILNLTLIVGNDQEKISLEVLNLRELEIISKLDVLIEHLYDGTFLPFIRGEYFTIIIKTRDYISIFFKYLNSLDSSEQHKKVFFEQEFKRIYKIITNINSICTMISEGVYNIKLLYKESAEEIKWLKRACINTEKNTENVYPEKINFQKQLFYIIIDSLLQSHMGLILKLKI